MLFLLSSNCSRLIQLWVGYYFTCFKFTCVLLFDAFNGYSLVELNKSIG